MQDQCKGSASGAAQASEEEKAHFEVMCWLSGISIVHFIIPLLFKKPKTSAFLVDVVGENKTASTFVYIDCILSVNYFPVKPYVGQL